MGLKYLGDSSENTVLQPNGNTRDLCHQGSLHQGFPNRATNDQGPEQLFSNKWHWIRGNVFGKR